MTRFLISSLVILIFLLIGSSTSAYVMSSTNYRIQKDSINIGGVSQSSSSYSLEETVGEMATDESTSTNYKLRAGYWAEFPDVLIFTLTNNTINLGTLATSAASTATTNFTVATSASDGYTVSVAGNTLTNDSNDIDAITTPATSFPGTEQFGINLVANTSPAVGSNPSGGLGQAAPGYNTPNNFKFVSGETVASSSSFSSTTTFTISYLVNISTSTAAGSYSTDLTLTATGVF